jgi:predicted nucleic acid-binding protein
VSRYLLDSNIISNATKPFPSQLLSAWMMEQFSDDLFIATMTLAEVWRGIIEKPTGKKRRDLESWFAGPEGPPLLFAGRILAFDAESGSIWARLMAEGTKMGRPRSPLDMIVAAVAEANDCVLVTDNEKHFAGMRFINPMRTAH